MTTVFENIYHDLGTEVGGLWNALDVLFGGRVILKTLRRVFAFRVSNHCRWRGLEGRQRNKAHFCWPRDEIYSMASVSTLLLPSS